MSGSACKRLRAKFVRDHGRSPRLAEFSVEPVKNQQGRISAIKVAKHFFRKLFAAYVVHKSEWRRLKKDYRLSRRNPCGVTA